MVRAAAVWYTGIRVYLKNPQHYLILLKRKQRLLRYETLEYIKYSCGSVPCIRYFLANSFSALGTFD